MDKKEEFQLITTFQKSCHVLKKSCEFDSNLVKQAEILLDSLNSSLGLRKVAGEFLYRCGFRRKDWLGLASGIEVHGLQFLIELCRKWMDNHGIKHQIGNCKDEFIFNTTFIQRICKYREEIRSALGEKQFFELKRKLTFVCLTLSELREENIVFKSLIKLNKNDEERAEMAKICETVFIYLPGNLLLLSMLSKDSYKPLPFLQKWLEYIPIWSTDQELASASSPLIAELLRHFQQETVDKIITSLQSKKHAIISNIVRCWLHRWVNHPNGIEAMQLIIEKLEERCMELLKLPKKCDWPPTIENFEDFTCMDLEWNWEESSGVTWPIDRVLKAYVIVWQAYIESFLKNTKLKTICIQSTNKIFQTALKWHEKEISEKAMQLLNYSDFTDSEKISFKKYAEQLGEEQKDDEHHEKVFIPSELTEDVIKKINPEKQLIQLYLSAMGSKGPGHVPTFPEVHKNLDSSKVFLNRNISTYKKDSNLRLIVKDITSFIEMCNESENAEEIYNILTRTRLKAIVDSGCSALENLICIRKQITTDYFQKCVGYLLDPNCEVRTLVLSRILFACCQNDRANFLKLWEQIESHLIEDSDASLLARLLKVVKHFVSQSDCDFPSKSYLILFSFCLEIQNSPNFLAKSAANIVFGFLLKRITTPRKLPLFKLIATQNELWNRWRIEKIGKFASLRRSQRILLLSLLKQYIIVHVDFYAEKEQITIARLLSQIYQVRLESPDIRERRFAIDVLIQLTPKDKLGTLQKLFNEPTSLNQKEDQRYFQYRIMLLKSVEESENQYVNIAELSEYGKIQQEIYANPEDSIQLLRKLYDQIDMENELAVQNLAIALNTVILQHGQNLDAINDIFFQLRRHSFSRVRSLASRAMKKE